MTDQKTKITISCNLASKEAFLDFSERTGMSVDAIAMSQLLNMIEEHRGANPFHLLSELSGDQGYETAITVNMHPLAVKFIRKASACLGVGESVLMSHAFREAAFFIGQDLSVAEDECESPRRGTAVGSAINERVEDACYLSLSLSLKTPVLGVLRFNQTIRKRQLTRYDSILPSVAVEDPEEAESVSREIAAGVVQYLNEEA